MSRGRGVSGRPGAPGTQRRSSPGPARWPAAGRVGAVLSTAVVAAAMGPPKGNAVTAPPRGPAAAGPTAPGAGVGAVASDSVRGHLFIVGGGSRPPELMQRFVELAGGPGRARIVVLPMASSEPGETGKRQAAGLRELGADARSLVLTREEAEVPSAADALADATGIWFSGGVQSRLAGVLRGTPLLDAVRGRYAAGAVVGGTSAGAAVLSDSMITGSQIRAGTDTLGYYGDEFRRVARGYIQVVPGFGLLHDAIVDQHFVRRERHNRLLSVVLERPGLLGVGIDESTALIVGPDGGWRVAGASVAVVYDPRSARITEPGREGPLGAAGVRLHVLPGGATYVPATGEVALSAEAEN